MASFGTWLRKQDSRKDAIGGLSKNIRADTSFPSSASIRGMEKYLLERGADRKVSQVLHKAYAEWALSQTPKPGPLPAT